MRAGRTFAAVVCALALAAPAFAQDDGSTKVTDDALEIAQTCFDAMASGNLQTQHDACIAASRKLDETRPRGWKSRHESNVLESMSAATLTAAGAAVASMAGERTQASCDLMEKAWQNHANFIQADQSPSFAQEMWKIRQQTLSAVRACREDFGRPPQASHLPGS
jgi:hypothetical protein